MFFLFSALSSAQFENSYLNYTIDDGLPSNETYTSILDNEGYLWIGTDKGIAKFDGIEFTVYDEDDGLEDLVVFQAYKDSKGVLWFGTMSGRLFYLEDNRFKEYKYNDLIVEAFDSRAFYQSFEIEDNHLVIIS